MVLLNDVSSLLNVRWSPELGNHVTAIKNLAPSTELFCESSYVSVILDEATRSLCHYCWKSVCHNHVEVFDCPNCDWVIYCSESCKTFDHFEHQFLCPLFGVVAERIAFNHGVTINRVRLLIKCLVVQYLELQGWSHKRYNDAGNVEVMTENVELSLAKCGDNNVSQLIQSTFEDITMMKTNREFFKLDWIECLEGTAKAILDIVPPELRVLSSDELVTFACVSDTNSFGISVGDSQYEIPSDLSEISNYQQRPPIAALYIGGLGIYPLCAKLNHSCYPSCQFSLASFLKRHQRFNAPLSMKTLRFVSENEDLTDSYVDLYSDRLWRRSELLRTKHFICDCKRCHQQLSNSMDRYINGYICTTCSSTKSFESQNDGNSQLKWNEVLAEAGECLAESKGISSSTKLMIAIRCILEDLSVLDYGWYQRLPDSLDLYGQSIRSSTENQIIKSSMNDSEKVQLRMSQEESRNKDKGSPFNGFSLTRHFLSQDVPTASWLYDPSDIPVLLPPSLDPTLGLELNESLERMFLEQRSIPPHLTDGKYRCEKCQSEVNLDEIHSQVEKSELLKLDIIDGFNISSNDSINALKESLKIRKKIGLFFHSFCLDLYHPFHSWLYRASQRVVDGTREIILHRSQSQQSLTNSSLTDLLLLDILFLRHQIACQSVIFPLFHEEKFLSFRVLSFILHQLATNTPSDLLDRISIDRDILRRAFSNCSSLYNENRIVLYGVSS